MLNRIMYFHSIQLFRSCDWKNDKHRNMVDLIIDCISILDQLSIGTPANVVTGSSFQLRTSVISFSVVLMSQDSPWVTFKLHCCVDFFWFWDWVIANSIHVNSKQNDIDNTERTIELIDCYNMNINLLYLIIL